MYIWCQGNQSESKKLFLLLSQCVRSKRNVKSLTGSYYTTARLHFGLKIGKKVKKFKPFGQTPPTSGHGTTSRVPLEDSSDSHQSGINPASLANVDSARRGPVTSACTPTNTVFLFP